MQVDGAAVAPKHRAAVVLAMVQEIDTRELEQAKLMMVERSLRKARESAPQPRKPVGATGAGDTFGGAFVARIVAGGDMIEAARCAVVAAALSTEGYGAVEPMPTAERVRAAMPTRSGT